MRSSTDSAPETAPVPGSRDRTRVGRAVVPILAVIVSLVLLVALVAADSAVAAGSSGAGGAAPAAAAHRASRHVEGRWSWPLPAPHDVLRGFDQPAEVWSPGHRGIDIAGPEGATVVAPDSGRVHFSGVVVDRPVLSIEHADGVVSSFEPVVGLVRAGETVARGQPVGILQAGHCAGETCLHLGARIDGDYVSPLLLLGEVKPAVLIPTRALP